MTPSQQAKAAGLKSLPEYIKEKFNGNQAAFAKAQDVQPPQVTQWINKGFIVADDYLYSPRRYLNKS